ncbi:MAG: tetratricopeptide repeat protein, partial [Chloroflexia bacterium]|nr:tetratricopeptide repeat protein [Chloroflexia bacterium]
MTPSQTVDELERALAQADEDSISRIDLLNTLAWELSDCDASRAMKLAEAAYALADSPAYDGCTYERGKAYSLRTQGYLDMRSGAYPRGMERLLRAQTLFEALRLEANLSVDDGLCDVFDGIAGIYAQMGDWSEGLVYSYKMLALAEPNGDLRRSANARNNLAHVFIESGDSNMAISLLQENADLAARIGYPRIEAISYLNLANAAFLAGDLPGAHEYALQGLRVVRAADFATFESYALDFLGKTRLKLGDHAAGLAYLQQALSVSRRIGSQVTEALNLLTLGQASCEIGQCEQALDYLWQSIAIAEAIQAKPELLAAHLALSELYERQGDLGRALAHHKQYHALKELVAGEKADRRLKVLQVIHDTEAAKREASALRLRADELQYEIGERKLAETHLQRQLATMRALSAFSAVLLTPATGEVARRQLLGLALAQLLEPAQASRASLHPNVTDPVMGLCSSAFAHAGAPGIGIVHDETMSFVRTIRPYLASAPYYEAEGIALLPWSLAPAGVAQKLAAGVPIGGLTQEVYADSPLWRDYQRCPGGHCSFQLFPVRIGEQWWGCINITDERSERIWSEEALLLLSAAAEMLASTIQRWQAEDQLHWLNNQLEEQVGQRTAELSTTVELLRREVHERERAEAAIQQMVVTLDQRLAAR